VDLLLLIWLLDYGPIVHTIESVTNVAIGDLLRVEG